jgi:uptake hydrogenase large subunit
VQFLNLQRKNSVDLSQPPKHHFRYFQNRDGNERRRSGATPVASLAALTIERSICLTAAVSGGRITAARLHDVSKRGVSGALRGRPLNEVPALARRLFPICGTAHACASLAAIERALGIAVSPAQAAFRDLLLLAEQGASAGWRLTMDWPALLGEVPDLRACAEIRRAAAAIQAVAPRDAWACIGGAHLRLDRSAIADRVARLVELLRALFPEVAAQSLGKFESDIARCANMPARMMRAAHALPSEYGAHDCPILTAEEAKAFAFSDEAVGAETTPLAAGCHPLLVDARAQWGRALAARILAAALNARVIAAQLDAILPRLVNDDPAPADGSRSGQGAAAVETARGPLAYYVEVEDGRVTRLSNLAPTDCNFHPRGPFVAALAAAPEVAEPVFAARLLAASFDPCAPFALNIVEPANGEVLCDA